MPVSWTASMSLSGKPFHVARLLCGWMLTVLPIMVHVFTYSVVDVGQYSTLQAFESLNRCYRISA